MKVSKGPREPERTWSPWYFEASAKEARKILTGVQYEYVKEQILLLCEEDNPGQPPRSVADVRPIEQYFELRDKHGLLGKINLRVFYCLLEELNYLVVLGVWKKEEEHQTPPRIKVRMRRRMKKAETKFANAQGKAKRRQ